MTPQPPRQVLRPARSHRVRGWARLLATITLAALAGCASLPNLGERTVTRASAQGVGAFAARARLADVDKPVRDTEPGAGFRRLPDVPLLSVLPVERLL